MARVSLPWRREPKNPTLWKSVSKVFSNRSEFFWNAGCRDSIRSRIGMVFSAGFWEYLTHYRSVLVLAVLEVVTHRKLLESASGKKLGVVLICF